MPIGTLGALGIGALIEGAGYGQRSADRNQINRNIERTIAANKEQALLEYYLQRKELKYMNQYNTPINQRLRLEEANLNPALMYKTAPQNVQTQLPKYQRPEIEYKKRAMQLPDVGNFIGSYQDVRMKNKQINMMEDIQREKTYDSLAAWYEAESKLLNLNVQHGLMGTEDKANYVASFQRQAMELRNEKLKADIETTKAGKQLRVLEQEMKREELELRRQGMSYNDNLLLRQLVKTGIWEKILLIPASVMSTAEPEFQEQVNTLKKIDKFNQSIKKGGKK